MDATQHAHEITGTTSTTAEMTAGHRRALEDMHAFSQSLIAAGEQGTDLTGVLDHLDPDPARYLSVEEGGGTLLQQIDEARELLSSAPAIDGYVRYPTRKVDGDGAASRPSIAVANDGRRLVAWIDWDPDSGERIIAKLEDAAGDRLTGPEPLSGTPTDCFRPRTAFDAAGAAWVFYARSAPAPASAGSVAVYARRLTPDGWEAEEQVSTTAHPSFNQEVVAHPDGSVECVWQGRDGHGFGMFSRRWTDGSWGEPERIDADVDGNVWDPGLVVRDDGTTTYVWCTYTGGSYGLVVCERTDAGLGDVRQITTGTDYALHPSLAVAGDGSIWCGFDLVTVHGHGGSGPTALVPFERLDTPPPLGMREAGRYVPPEMRPYSTTRVHVVRLTGDGIEHDPIPLGEGFEANPSGMPQLAATAGGGVTIAYRVLRRLPLLHYYWEVAVQQLGPDGPGPVCTLADSDGGMEEPAVAMGPAGAVVVATTDHRKAHVLTWADGFGGQRRAELAAHVGEVAWNGLHGDGDVLVAEVPEIGVPRRGQPAEAITSDEREESRAWAGWPQERYRTEVDGRTMDLYWGDLHRHSLISRCTAADDPGIDDFYRFAWDVSDYDFWAVTDHAENSTAHQWWTIQKIADLFHVPGRFVPMYGFEWTSEYGHQNVIYDDVRRGAPIFSSTDEATDDPDKLWAAMRRFPDFPAITIPHHPGAAMVAYDWSFGDPDLLRLVEVFQSCRGNYEVEGCFRQYEDATLSGTFTVDGLRAGNRFGLIASSDHGFGASYVGAYADGLERSDVFSALHARRTVAATARGIVVDVRIGDTFMGGERQQDGPVELEAYVRGYRDLARIDVVKDGEVAHSIQPNLDLPEGWIAVPMRVEFGRAGAPSDWSGTLTVSGGEVLATPYWSREVREVTRESVRWEARTHSFGGGGLYGPTRGGIELTIVGPPEAAVEVATASGAVSASLAEIRDGGVDADGPRAPQDSVLRLQPSTGGLTSLGDRERSFTWTDPQGGPAFYYLRVFLVDGEMAWSSPIWVDPVPA